jgi:hypothetical protein
VLRETITPYLSASSMTTVITTETTETIMTDSHKKGQIKNKLIENRSAFESD